MAISISYNVRHRAERTDIWQGRITGAAAGAVYTLPIAAKEIIALQAVATDGSPVVFKPNTTRAKAFYATLGSDETFDVTVWYVRGSGASLTIGGTGSTTTTTTTTT